METGSPVRSIYFPYSGVISLVVGLSSGDNIETAMIGQDGVFDARSGLGGRLSLVKAVVHQAGESGAIGVDFFRQFAEKYEPLRAFTMQHNHGLYTEIRQAAACNACHSVEARICRWLLRIRDLTRSNEFPITQELLAQMLGVRRPSISVAAAALQKSGLISYYRGRVYLRDVGGLKEVSCECYEVIRSAYAQLELVH